MTAADFLRALKKVGKWKIYEPQGRSWADITYSLRDLADLDFRHLMNQLIALQKCDEILMCDMSELKLFVELEPVFEEIEDPYTIAEIVAERSNLPDSGLFVLGVYPTRNSPDAIMGAEPKILFARRNLQIETDDMESLDISSMWRDDPKEASVYARLTIVPELLGHYRINGRFRYRDNNDNKFSGKYSELIQHFYDVQEFRDEDGGVIGPRPVISMNDKLYFLSVRWNVKENGPYMYADPDKKIIEATPFEITRKRRGFFTRENTPVDTDAADIFYYTKTADILRFEEEHYIRKSRGI